MTFFECEDRKSIIRVESSSGVDDEVTLEVLTLKDDTHYQSGRPWRHINRMQPTGIVFRLNAGDRKALKALL